MATGIYTWLQAGASNGAVDSAIQWPEGQLPPTITPSFRGMMAVLAKWRDDWSGVRPGNVAMITTGSANTQALVTNGSAQSLVNGWTLCFRMGYTNSGPASLAVDGLAPKPMQTKAGVPLVGGELIAGRSYVATYQQRDDCWLFRNDPGEFPGGTRMAFNQTTAPVGWTKDSTVDNSAMRTVTGTAGSGGISDFTTVFAARTIAKENLPSGDLTHTLTASGVTTTENQSHTHSYLCPHSTSEMKEPGSGVSLQLVKLDDLTELTLGNESVQHTHEFGGPITGTISLGGSGTAWSFAVKYRDFIIAQKD